MPTNWTSVRQRYGLERPFDFKIAVPFLLNAALLAGLLLTCAAFFLSGDLKLGTARFYFFAYVACLLLLAAAFSRATLLSYAVLCWCTLELSLALASGTLQKHGFGRSLYPKNVVVSTADDDFIYHPLLQIVPRPNWQYKDDLQRFSIGPRQLEFSHNSLGFRGKEPTPADQSKEAIFVYGGSTTYDITNTQGETWVDRLQGALADRYNFLNFGVIAHSTAEHLIHTTFYQNIIGKKPVCALYYIGWNDIINSHIDKLDSAYADYHLLLTPVRKPDLALAKYSPLLFLLNAVAKQRFDTIPRHAPLLGKPPGSGSDPHLEAIFIENVRTIAAINHARGTKAIFVGQMLNKGWPGGPHLFAPLVKEGDYFPIQQRFNTILADAAAASSAKYIDAGVENFDKSDFVDLGHFTAAGAEKFAMLISKEVGDYCN